MNRVPLGAEFFGLHKAIFLFNDVTKIRNCERESENGCFVIFGKRRDTNAKRDMRRESLGCLQMECAECEQFTTCPESTLRRRPRRSSSCPLLGR